MLKKNDKELNWDKKHPLILACILLIISLVVYRDFLFGDKLYLYTDVGADTINSYFPYMSYIADSWRNGASWSFNIGIGTSMYTLSVFLFDPINWIAFLLGKDNLVFILPYIMIFKIIGAGILFYYYLLTVRISSYAAILFAIYFAFSGYMILWGQHYQFASALLYSAFILLGFERWFQKSKWGFFLISITLMAVFSLYFLYMISLYLVFYFLFRYFEEKTFNYRTLIKYISKGILIYIFAFAIGSFFILPNIYILLNSPRIEGDLAATSVFQLASINEYISMVLRFFSNDLVGTGNSFFGYFNYYESPNLYMGLLTLLIIPYLFLGSNRKEKIIYTCSICIIILCLIFPYFSIIMNGFSGMSYRWTFIIMLFFLFLCAKSMNRIEINKNIQPKVLIVSFFVIVLIHMFAYYIGKKTLLWSDHQLNDLLLKLALIIIYILIYMLLLYLWSKGTKNKWYKFVIIFAVIVEVTIMANVSVNVRPRPDKSLVTEQNGYNQDKAVINAINEMDSTFYRIEKENNNVFLTDSLMQGYYGIKSYNSLNHSSYIEFLNEMEIPLLFNHPNYIQGTTNTPALSLLSVKYYISDSGNYPLGFYYVGENNGKKIYQNEFSLPLGFLYSEFSRRSQLEKLAAKEKERMLMYTAVIEDKDFGSVKNIREFKDFNNKQIYNPITLEMDIGNAIIENSKLVQKTKKYTEVLALNSDSQIIFPLKKHITDSNTKVGFSIESKINSTGQVFWSNVGTFSEDQSVTFDLLEGEHNYTIDLGNISFSEIRLDISNAAGSFKVKNVHLEMSELKADYSSYVKRYNDTQFKLTEFKQDNIKGQVSVKSKSILFLSIPYDEGWKVKIDGEKVSSIKLNYGFLGTIVDEGYHSIEIDYEAPLKFEGFWISIISLVILIVGVSKRKFINKIK